MPKVSVIIPAYNCASFIADAVRSVLGQVEHDVEVIAVDDGSTDDTSTVLACFGNAIQVVRQENRGAAAARNAGLSIATGDWVAFLDADDYWMPNRLALQLRALQEFPDAGLAFSDFEVVDASGMLLRRSGIRWKYRSVKDPIATSWSRVYRESVDLTDGVDGTRVRAYCDDLYGALFRGNLINTSSVLVSRDLLSASNGFDASLDTEEDYDCWLHVARLSKFVFVDAPLVAFRVRPNQLTEPAQLERIVRNVLRVAERASRNHAASLSAREVDSRLGILHRDLGVLCLRGGRNAEARRHLWISLKADPWRPMVAVLLAIAVLPAGLINALEALKRSIVHRGSP